MKINYRNILPLLAVVAVGLSNSGCKKFLDQHPITEVGPDVAFKDVQGAYTAIIGVYSRLAGDQGYGKVLSLYFMQDTDENEGPSGLQDDRRALTHYSLTPSNTELSPADLTKASPYDQLFKGIDLANVCLDNIPKMTLYNGGSDQQKLQLRRMVGEAYTLRAQFYMEAIRNWGDLPAHFTPAYTQAAQEPFPGVTDRDTLYNHILADLKIAEDLVPWRNEVTSIGDQVDERITKGTVKALRARIALFRGGYSLRPDRVMRRPADYLTFYQIARDETNDIITSGQHNLNPSFKSLWKDQVCAHAVADPDGELMFQVSSIGAGAAEDSKLGYYDGPKVNGFGNAAVNPLPSYFYSFDSTDLRRDVTIAPYNVNLDSTKVGLGTTALNDGKYRRDWLSNPGIKNDDALQYFGLKWQLIRYSDVLLMFAEAENELNGPTALSYDAINKVRRRGYGKPINTPDPTVDLSGLSKSSFFDAIVKERSLELGCEGIRKYDLVRWNLLAQKISDTRAVLQAMVAKTPPYNNLPSSMYYYNNSKADDKSVWANSFYKPQPSSTPPGTTKITWIGSSITTSMLTNRWAAGFTPNKSELLPIPQRVIDVNFNIRQNPGY
jgi:starch-binding outer membrane protein, SusD/RagB family